MLDHLLSEKSYEVMLLIKADITSPSILINYLTKSSGYVMYVTSTVMREQSAYMILGCLQPSVSETTE